MQLTFPLAHPSSSSCVLSLLRTILFVLFFSVCLIGIEVYRQGPIGLISSSRPLITFMFVCGLLLFDLLVGDHGRDPPSTDSNEKQKTDLEIWRSAVTPPPSAIYI